MVLDNEIIKEEEPIKKKEFLKRKSAKVSVGINKKD